MPESKAVARKVTIRPVWSDSTVWSVCFGELCRGRGRPGGVDALFKVVAEKMPFESLGDVRRGMESEGLDSGGVYVAHDSTGYARYVGRGAIFARLRARRNAYPAELCYFSSYVVADKKHEREIETLLIRAAGPHLHFNTRRRRIDIQPGDVRDFEAGTKFFERQGRRGRKRVADI